MKRVAILGLGRSGFSSLRAARSRGLDATVLEQKSESEAQSGEHYTSFKDDGAEIVFGIGDSFDFSGFDTLIVSPGVPKTNSLLGDALKQGVDVISEIELAYRVANAPIVAVTGTNGKSTTAVLTMLCLRSAGVEAVLCGNIYGSGYPEIPLTEAAASSAKDQILVAEVSSFQLEWVHKFRPRAALITNISDDHLNRYASFGEYAETKRRIFERLGDGDFAVWRKGDALTKPPVGPNVLTFGSPEADACADDRELTVLGSSVKLCELPFSEAHNVLNAQGAALLAYGATNGAADLGRILAGLKDFKGLRHRMERLGTKNGIKVINNSMCTNPAAVVASSHSIPGRQHLLIGGVDKDMNFAPLRDYLKENRHAAYVFGRDAELIARQLGGGWPVFETMDEAFCRAASAARPGETIMLAPGAASMDQFADFRDRGDRFILMAKEWLKS